MLALVIAALAIHVRVIAGRTWDDIDYHARVAPPRLAAATQVHDGMFPRWWEGSSWGVPLLAEPSHGVADPMMWLAATPHGLDVVLVLHIAWLAIGLGLWARRAGASKPAAIAAGILLIATGVITSAAQRGALPGIADLPWIGWAALGLARAESRRARGVNAIIIGLLLGAVALAGEFAAVIDGAAIAIAVGGNQRTLGWLGGALAAGLAIGGALWIPALAWHGAGATVHGIGLPRLVELVVPGAFGSTDPAYGVAALGGGAATAWPSLFFGAPLVALALAYRASPGSIDTRGRALVIGLGVLALLVGRGGWPAGLGAPEVHAAALAIVLAVRAARGLDGLLAGERRARVAIGIAASVAALATWCMVALRDPSAPAIDRALVDGGLGVACMIGAFALARRARYAAVILAVLPSVIATRSTEVTASSAILDHQPRWVTDGLAMFKRPPRRMYRPPSLTKNAPDASLADAIATMAGTSAARWGIAAARSDDPARLPEEAAAWKASSNNGGTLLERFGVGLAVLPRSVVENGKMPELDSTGDWALADYPAAPPAVTVSDWEWSADAASAFKTLFPPDGSRGVAVDRGELIGSGPSPDTGGVHHANTCDIARWAAGAIDLTCKSPSAAYAIASSSATPGWTAEVDGVATPWVAADVLRRAVYMPAGTHEVRWRYHVPGLPAGLVIAALGIALLGALGWLASRT